MLIAIGSGLGVLGIGGGLLVRLNPETRTNINYDPSTVALFSPVPLGIGCGLVLWFMIRTKRPGS
jgi:hypothetical protein